MSSKKIDEKWEKVKQVVFERDNNQCQLSKVLTANEWDYIREYHDEDFKWLSQTLDCCHIFPKGSHPEFKYKEDNLVTVCRYFHTLLDELKNPVTRAPITSDVRLRWYYRARWQI